MEGVSSFVIHDGFEVVGILFVSRRGASNVLLLLAGHHDLTRKRVMLKLRIGTLVLGRVVQHYRIVRDTEGFDPLGSGLGARISSKSSDMSPHAIPSLDRSSRIFSKLALNSGKTNSPARHWATCKLRHFVLKRSRRAACQARWGR